MRRGVGVGGCFCKIIEGKKKVFLNFTFLFFQKMNNNILFKEYTKLESLSSTQGPIEIVFARLKSNFKNLKDNFSVW